METISSGTLWHVAFCPGDLSSCSLQILILLARTDIHLYVHIYVCTYVMENVRHRVLMHASREALPGVPVLGRYLPELRSARLHWKGMTM
jgi:hypothetical protein